MNIKIPSSKQTLRKSRDDCRNETKILTNQQKRKLQTADASSSRQKIGKNPQTVHTLPVPST